MVLMNLRKLISQTSKQNSKHCWLISLLKITESASFLDSKGELGGFYRQMMK